MSRDGPGALRLADRADPAPVYDPAAYWSSRLAAGSGLEGVGYRGLGEAFNHWLYRRRADLFRRVARRVGWDAHPPSVLELGPGTGFYIDLWRDLGVRELTGVEIARPAVERLRARYPDYRFVDGDIGREPSLPRAAFDVVTAFDVLFHLTDDRAFERAIAAAAGALRPGGLFLITDLFPRGRRICLPHQVSRTERDYREALARHGLALRRQWPVFVLMHPWAQPRARLARAFAAAWWWAVPRIAGHVPGAGGPLGAGLYVADALLTRLVRPGPSTRLWVVERVTRGPHPPAPSPNPGRGGDRSVEERQPGRSGRMAPILVTLGGEASPRPGLGEGAGG